MPDARAEAKSAAMTAADIHAAILAAWRIEQPRLITSLSRMLRDVPLAEELTQDALVAALEDWPKSGVPERLGAWLMATAKHRALDHLRRGKMLTRKHEMLAVDFEREQQAMPDFDASLDDDIGDEMLRLIFTACHPLLSREARAALALRMICGLTTEEIARAFLVTPATLAQRIVRAKAKIRETPIPYEVSTLQELPERLDAVLRVVYLVFNEGYSAAAGAEVTRAEITGEAIRLGRLLAGLQPEPEVDGLLALMLLQESRRAARTSPAGELILLEHQDRALWNREQIAEGVGLVEKALSSRRFGPYTLQAAIAAVHAEAESTAATDWRQIVTLYNQLVRIQPSPVVHLNRAVAIAMCDGPEAGLKHIEAMLEHGELANYYLAHSARAELYRRLGRTAEARASYERALALTQQEPERQFLQERIRQLK
jgi:RNA polymerase sigma-70 factor (ECF subfamily)